MEQASLSGKMSVRRFTDAQKSTLNRFYKLGMKGVGMKHLHAIKMCSQEIGCSIEKVKVSGVYAK